MIMTTHKHWDHADGNTAVKHAYPSVEIVGGAIDKVKECTKFVNDQDEFEVLGGEYQVKCHHTPCHTTGHILFEVSAKAQQPTQDNNHQRSVKNGYQVI